MRTLTVGLLAVALSVTSVSTVSAQSQLPAGKPAGVKSAQILDTSALLIIGGVSAFAAVFAVVAANSGQVNAPVSTTTNP